jgi:Arc/MetJ-type ribon-helix-helix transcriptional regulator
MLNFKDAVRHYITTSIFKNEGDIMRSTITISLSQQMRSELDRLSRSEGISLSDIVRECLRDYMYIRQFHSTRKRMVEKAAQQGIFTDQDVFDRVSK